MNTDLIFTAQAACKAGGGSITDMMFPMIIIFAILYFMMIRPQQRKEKERLEMIKNLKSGTKVLFCGGLIGVITNVKDQSFIIKVADSSKLEVAKGAVSSVLEKGDKIEDIEKK